MGKALMVASFSSTLITNTAEFNAIGLSGAPTTEASAQIAASGDCAFTGLRLNYATGASGLNTVQFRDAGANGQNVVSRTGPGTAEDTTHTDSLTAGDLFNLAHTDNGTDPGLGWVALNVEFASGHGGIHGVASNIAVFDVASATRFIALAGGLVNDGGTVEADSSWRVRGYDTFDALQVRVSANARTNDSVFKNRINAGDGTGVCTFGAGVSGLMQDTGIGDAITAGQNIGAAITLLTGVEDLDVTIVSATLKSATSKSDCWAGLRAGATRAASATAHYFTIGGAIPATVTAFTEAQARIKPGFAATCSNLRCYLSANTYTVDATLKLYVNGSAVLTTTLTNGGGAAWYENAADTFDIDDNDELSFEIVGGTSGSATIHSIGITFAPIAAAGGSTSGNLMLLGCG